VDRIGFNADSDPDPAYYLLGQWESGSLSNPDPGIYDKELHKFIAESENVEKK
jgi:hypothetical protein